MGLPANRCQGRGQREAEYRFVELRGMPGNPVAKIDSPRQICNDTVGLVAEARQETADAANGNPQGQRNREQIPSAARDAQALLGLLYGNRPAQQPADNRLAAQ